MWDGANGAAVVPAQAHSGAYSLQTHGAGSSASQRITGLKPHTSYVLTGWGKVSDPSTEARIGVIVPGGPDASVILSNTAYAQGQVTFTTGRAGTSAMIDATVVSGTGYAWFDDFALHQAGQLTNGSFEQSVPGDWITDGPAQVVRGGAHAGRYALREDGAAVSARQTVYGLSPDTFYQLTGFARVSGAGNAAVIGIQGSTGQPIAGTVTDSRYQKVSLQFTTGPTVTAATVFCSKPVGDGSAWFDDLRLTAVRSPGVSHVSRRHLSTSSLLARHRGGGRSIAQAGSRAEAPDRNRSV